MSACSLGATSQRCLGATHESLGWGRFLEHSLGDPQALHKLDVKGWLQDTNRSRPFGIGSSELSLWCFGK